MSFSTGIPVVTDQMNEVLGKFVTVTWNRLFEGACPADKYTIYYRDVKSARWKPREVFKNTTRYDLELECFKEYELAVTATWRRNGETPRNISNHWKLKTGQGKTENWINKKNCPKFARFFEKNHFFVKHRTSIGCLHCRYNMHFFSCSPDKNSSLWLNDFTWSVT